MTNKDWRLFEGWCRLITSAAKCCIEGLNFTKDVLYRFDYKFDFGHTANGEPFCNERVLVYSGCKVVSMTPEAFDRVFRKEEMNMMT